MLLQSTMFDIWYYPYYLLITIYYAWAFTAHWGDRTIQEASGAFAIATSSMMMEIMAVTKVFIWLESLDYTHACILSDSLSMI
jgi:ribonuclease HI